MILKLTPCSNQFMKAIVFKIPLRQYLTVSSKVPSKSHCIKPITFPNLVAMSSRRSARLSSISVNSKVEIPSSPPHLPSKSAISRKRKTIVQEVHDVPKDDAEITPSTPKRKRVTKVVPPITPTPSAVKLMSSPHHHHGNMSPPPAINRLAIPEGTNATLVTPETHRLVASKPVDQISPSKKSVLTTTTSNILDEALAHLVKVEPKLKAIIDNHPCNVFSAEGLAEEIDPFNSLISGIISQQVLLMDTPSEPFSDNSSS